MSDNEVIGLIMTLMVACSVLIVLIVNLFNYFNNKNKFRLLSDALDSSQLSPDVIDRLVNPAPRKGSGNGLLNAGLILAGFGVGLGILLWVEAGFSHACVGCLFIFTGVGMLASHYLVKKKS